jgi:hypothetical protein
VIRDIVCSPNPKRRAGSLSFNLRAPKEGGFRMLVVFYPGWPAPLLRTLDV